MTWSVVDSKPDCEPSRSHSDNITWPFSCRKVRGSDKQNDENEISKYFDMILAWSRGDLHPVEPEDSAWIILDDRQGVTFAGEVFLKDSAVDDERIFKAFCNRYRLLVLERLRTGEKCACDLLEHIDISQSNLSHHMGILVESGIVSARQVGKWTYYSIDPMGAERAIGRLTWLTEVNHTEGVGNCGE